MNDVMSKIVDAANIIAERSRNGRASYVVVNGFVAYLIKRQTIYKSKLERKILKKVELEYQPLRRMYDAYCNYMNAK